MISNLCNFSAIKVVHLVQDSGYAAGGVGGNIDASVLLAIELANAHKRTKE